VGAVAYFMGATVRLVRLCILVFLGTAPGFTAPLYAQESSSMSEVLYAGKVNAPDFPTGLDWLNTDRPLSLKEFRGKVVLLDFWTFCCINCMHVLPDLKRLEQKYARELVVIGVHSAKFTTERGTENIREAILRYDIDHPVVNDRDFAVWNSYGANAWPTFVLIDPDGRVVARHSGEGVYELFVRVIGSVVEEFDRKGRVDRTARVFAMEKSRARRSLFSYPGKIAADHAGKRLFITDSNHHRIVVLSLPDHTVLTLIGSGREGLRDGSFEEAEFNRPQGVCVVGEALYVADTENHAIRKVDLASGTIVTLAGTGRQAQVRNEAGRGTSVALNSPWDLLENDGILYIAMAGPHQIWTLDLRTLEAKPYAGSGREDIIDGRLQPAALAQPSGIATDGKVLYVADSEVSAVRSVDLLPTGEVRTIVGQGLFEFGDRDGKRSSVRLQHPIGIVFHGGALYVADTYNNKIKRIDPVTGFTSSLIGDGKVGSQDGPVADARLNEPNGLVVVGERMYITDTNNHVIRFYDFDRGVVGTVKPRLAEKLAPRGRGPGAFAGTVTHLPVQEVREGRGSLRIALSLPDGYAWNSMAPFYVGVFSADSAVAVPLEGEKNIDAPAFPLEIPVVYRQGLTSLLVDLIVYYCEAKSESVCLVKQIRLEIPVRAGKESGDRVVTVEYRLEN